MSGSCANFGLFFVLAENVSSSTGSALAGPVIALPANRVSRILIIHMSCPPESTPCRVMKPFMMSNDS
jgi:hypothetical protein